MSKWLVFLAATCVLCGGISSGAEELHLTPKNLIEFASIARAKEILTNRDEFIKALSPFDRAARMKTAAAPSEQAFMDFLRENALAWEPAESNRIAGVVRTLEKDLAQLHLALPAKIELVKTTGHEEGDAAYTRQNAIILSRHEADSVSIGLLAHELFHVLSRNDPRTRERLYRVIGFLPINEVEFPAELRPIKITNPDGVHNNSMIVVRIEDQPISVLPILYSSAPKYDESRSGEFFQYLVFKLLALEKTGGRYQPHLVAGKAQVLEPTEVSGFFEQIGRNTQYILHPDEILADNFTLLVQHKSDLQTPKIPAEMRRILSEP